MTRPTLKLDNNARGLADRAWTNRARSTIGRRRRIAGGQTVSRTALSKALDMAPDAVFFLTPELRIVDVNAAAIGSSGYLRSELLAMSLTAILADESGGQLPADVDRVVRREVLEAVLAARQLTKRGDSLAVRIQLEWFDDEAGSLLIAVVQRVVTDGAPDEVLDVVDGSDHLTALPTRGALERRLQRAERRARRRQTRFAVLFIDLDQFKGVNDRGGHRSGDFVLQTFGQRLRACMRPGDFVARYGGDEFVVVVEDVGSDVEVERIAERIRAALAEPIQLPAGEVRISASVGAAIGHAFSSAVAVLDEADRAMYREKNGQKTAKNIVC